MLINYNPRGTYSINERGSYEWHRNTQDGHRMSKKTIAGQTGTRKKRAAYADSLILTILKFQCLAGIIRNSLISRSISSAGLQKRHRVWLHPCTFRELYRG